MLDFAMGTGIAPAFERSLAISLPRHRQWHPPLATSSRSIIPSAISPMLASGGAAMPEEDGWTFEPKFDGIRVLAFATDDYVALVTRNGNDKAAQFPEIAQALRSLADSLGRSAILDGEIVALDDDC